MCAAGDECRSFRLPKVRATNGSLDVIPNDVPGQR
jgi:hypothetical protein